MDLDKMFSITGMYMLPQLPQTTRTGDVALNMRAYMQTQSYTCGFVATYTALSYWNSSVKAKPLYKEMKMDDCGFASETKIVKTVRAHGLSCGRPQNLRFKEVSAIIDKGYPIICSTQWDMHWIVICGYNRDRKEVLVCGETPRRQTWKDFKANGGCRGGSVVVIKR